MFPHIIENIGVLNEQSKKDRIRIRTINRLNIICIFFCVLYSIFFYINHLWFLFFAVLILMQIFILGIYLNYLQKHFFSIIAVIVSTNLGVLIFGLFLGFNSGVHIINLTAPLIIFLIFDFKEKTKIKLALILYSSNLAFQIIAHKYKFAESVQVIDSEFYIMNIIAAFLLLTVLTYYFAAVNNTVNADLHSKNLKLANTILEKDLLLSEVHHRVKNNLAVISGILSLQAMSLDDEKTQKELNDTQKRIKSMSLIHENFYQKEQLISINFEEHIHLLTDELNKSCINTSKINFIVSNNSVKLNFNTSISLSLLVNEILNFLISNKHKENNSQRTIQFVLSQIDNQFSLNISDDGYMKSESTTEKSSDEFSFDLIYALTSQIEGKLDFVIDNITEFKITFPVK